MSLENQICYEANDHAAKCPITALKFVSKSEATSKYQPDAAWTVVDFTSTHSVVYSKALDNLPVTKSLIETRPCLDPKFTSTTPDYFFYELEIDRLSAGCPPLEEYSDQQFDTRFEKAGFQIDQKTLQDKSGVLDTLFFLPKYTKSFPDYKDRKSTVIYDFWTRSTIRWSLECDAQDGKSRKEVY